VPSTASPNWPLPMATKLVELIEVIRGKCLDTLAFRSIRASVGGQAVSTPMQINTQTTSPQPLLLLAISPSDDDARQRSCVASTTTLQVGALAASSVCVQACMHSPHQYSDFELRQTCPFCMVVQGRPHSSAMEERYL